MADVMRAQIPALQELTSEYDSVFQSLRTQGEGNPFVDSLTEVEDNISSLQDRISTMQTAMAKGASVLTADPLDLVELKSQLEKAEETYNTKLKEITNSDELKALILKRDNTIKELNAQGERFGVSIVPAEDVPGEFRQYYVKYSKEINSFTDNVVDDLGTSGSTVAQEWEHAFFGGCFGLSLDSFAKDISASTDNTNSAINSYFESVGQNIVSTVEAQGSSFDNLDFLGGLLDSTQTQLQQLLDVDPTEIQKNWGKDAAFWEENLFGTATEANIQEATSTISKYIDDALAGNITIDSDFFEKNLISGDLGVGVVQAIKIMEDTVKDKFEQANIQKIYDDYAKSLETISLEESLGISDQGDSFEDKISLMEDTLLSLAQNGVDETSSAFENLQLDLERTIKLYEYLQKKMDDTSPFQKASEEMEKTFSDDTANMLDNLYLKMVDFTGGSEDMAVVLTTVAESAFNSLSSTLSGMSASMGEIIAQNLLLEDGTASWQDLATAAGEYLQSIAELIPQLMIQAGLTMLTSTDTRVAGMAWIAAGIAAGASAGISGAILESANGNAFDSSGHVSAFATGGTFTNSIVSSPTYFPFANGTGLMGEAGPEAILPLTRTASGNLGVETSGAGGSNVNVIINNYSSEDVSQTETTGEDGSRNIEVLIGKVMKQKHQDGSMASTMKSTYGVSQTGRSA